MQNIFIILLGCNIYSILLNRLETSFKYIEFETQKTSQTNILTNVLDISTSTSTSISTSTSTYTSSYSYIRNNINSNIKITWFLSGGIKYNHHEAKSEASIMKSYINDFIFKKKNKYESYNKITWDFVLDELSTNTAENFIRASDFLNKTKKSYDSIYIVTSNFHYKRASIMMNMIDSSRQYKWILGDKEMEDSRSWEIIHMKNVQSDVLNAFGLIK